MCKVWIPLYKVRRPPLQRCAQLGVGRLNTLDIKDKLSAVYIHFNMTLCPKLI